MGAAVVVEGPHPHALLAQQVEVDVRHGAAVADREALGLREQDAVLVDGRLPVPGEVRGRLALPGRRVDVGGQAARGLRPAQELAVLRAPDGDRAAREVQEHGRARERGLRARRDRHPQVLADLRVDHEPGDVGGLEEQVGAERDARARDGDLAADVVARGDLPALVELAVGRQVRLRRDAEDAAAVHHHGAVEDPAAGAQRGAEREHGAQVRRRRHDRLERGLDAVEHRVLEQQVLDRVARQAQLREQRDGDALLLARPGLAQHRLGVRARVGDRDALRAGGDAGEAVLVDAVEVHARASPTRIVAVVSGRPRVGSSGGCQT